MGYELKIEKKPFKGAEYYYNVTKAGDISISYKSNKWEAPFDLYVQIGNGGSVTGVCGQISFTELRGALVAAPKVKKLFKEEMKPVIGAPPAPAVYGAPAFPDELKKELVENGAFKEISLALHKAAAEDLAGAFTKHTVVFGGRVNITPETYLMKWGLYSGSFARYLAKNNIGALTASHIHHNYNHHSVADYSLQQVFVWSAPKIQVLPINKRYVGAFIGEELEAQHIKDMTTFLGVSPKSVKLKPRYFLKNPFMKMDEEVK